MLNHISLMGRFTAAPDLRHTANSTPVASFTLAVERDYQTGGKEKQTDFINCVAWRSTAEFISKYFNKGSMAAVSGRVQVRSYEDKVGNKRTATEVVVENIYFAGEKKASDTPRPYGDQYAPEPGKVSDAGDYAAQSSFYEMPGDDGDLPF